MPSHLLSIPTDLCESRAAASLLRHSASPLHHVASLLQRAASRHLYGANRHPFRFSSHRRLLFATHSFCHHATRLLCLSEHCCLLFLYLFGYCARICLFARLPFLSDLSVLP